MAGILKESVKASNYQEDIIVKEIYIAPDLKLVHFVPAEKLATSAGEFDYDDIEDGFWTKPNEVEEGSTDLSYYG